jgi:tetratricopeptide (TPR) repeat protein
MNCAEVEERDIPELYLLDKLTEAERDDFEKHYFDCESCFAQLEAGFMAQAELRRQPPQRAQTRGASFLRAWAWAPAFVTALLLLAAGLWWYSARSRLTPQVASAPHNANQEVGAPTKLGPPRTPSLEELARVEPPAYNPVVLRGAEDQAQEAFRKAMSYYVKGQYANAIAGLKVAVKESPRTARYNFYLAVCYLVTDQPDLAVEYLRKTSSSGEPAYSELTHFYLAKAYLQKKNVSAAEDELQATMQLHGDKEAEAGKILRQLRQ